MRKFFFMSLMLLIMVCSNAYAFLDIFTDAIHQNSVRNHFIGALSTEEKAWKSGDIIAICPGEKCYVFIPENEDKEFSDESFLYFEYDLSKSKEELSRLRDLNSFYKEWFSEQIRSPWCTEKILSQNSSEIRSESYSALEAPMFDRSTHRISKIVQISKEKFVAYEYKVRKKHLSEEEKKFWLAKIDWARVNLKKLAF